MNGLKELNRARDGVHFPRVLSVGLSPQQMTSLRAVMGAQRWIDVSDTFDAIDVCITADFDLVIVNDRGGEISGDEFLQGFESCPFHPCVPCVLINEATSATYYLDTDQYPEASELALEVSLALTALPMHPTGNARAGDV